MKRSVYIPKGIWERLGKLAELLGRPSRSNVICYLVDLYAQSPYSKNTGKTSEYSQTVFSHNKLLPDPLNVSRETIGSALGGSVTDGVGRLLSDGNVGEVASECKGDIVEITMPDGFVVPVPVGVVELLNPEYYRRLRSSKEPGLKRTHHPKRVGGVIRLSMAELEKLSPEVAKKIRGMGPCTDESVVEFHPPAKATYDPDDPRRFIDEPGECEAESFRGVRDRQTVDNVSVDGCDHEVTEFDKDLNADICANCGQIFYKKPDVVDVVKADEENRKEKAVSQLKRDLDEIVFKGVRPYSKKTQLGKDRKK